MSDLLGTHGQEVTGVESGERISRLVESASDAAEKAVRTLRAQAPAARAVGEFAVTLAVRELTRLFSRASSTRTATRVSTGAVRSGADQSGEAWPPPTVGDPA